jgi:hypothetical protein
MDRAEPKGRIRQTVYCAPRFYSTWLKAMEASMNEKEAIEKATADAFVELYNREMGTSFSIVEYSDAPDIRCKDKRGNTFNFEITLTEDRPRDIQAALGRSNHRSIEALRQHLADVKVGKANPLEWVSCLQENVTRMVVSNIIPKLQKDYGSSVGLVIRDTSPVCWNWELVLDDINKIISSYRNSFDKGIWIIPYRKDRIFRII